MGPGCASEEFGKRLIPFIPSLASADFERPFDQLTLPDELLRAVIVHRGELTPDYAYLSEHVKSASA